MLTKAEPEQNDPLALNSACATLTLTNHRVTFCYHLHSRWQENVKKKGLTVCAVWTERENAIMLDKRSQDDSVNRTINLLSTDVSISC